MCSEAWRRRRAGVGMRGALRTHHSAQATADIFSEREHIPETELQDQNYEDDEMWFNNWVKIQAELWANE